MSYLNIRTKLNKFEKGGKIPKYDRGSAIQKLIEAGFSQEDAEGLYDNSSNISRFNENIFLSQMGVQGLTLSTEEQNTLSSMSMADKTLNLSEDQLNDDSGLTQTPGAILTPPKKQDPFHRAAMTAQQSLDEAEDADYDVYKDALKTSQVTGAEEQLYDQVNAIKAQRKADLNAKAGQWAADHGVDSQFIGDGKGQMSGMGAAATAAMSAYGTKALDLVDNMTMGDKNFGVQSKMVDGAVDVTSQALISSGNPYAMAAGVALKGANFLTKAGGRTVQGYDVDIDNSGYGNLGHMESSSSRDWGAAIGLGGLFGRGNMEAKLKRRNEQARMALAAAEISNDIGYEQEARSNSIDNVLMNNKMALAGGTEFNTLGD